MFCWLNLPMTQEKQTKRLLLFRELLWHHFCLKYSMRLHKGSHPGTWIDSTSFGDGFNKKMVDSPRVYNLNGTQFCLDLQVISILPAQSTARPFIKGHSRCGVCPYFPCENVPGTESECGTTNPIVLSLCIIIVNPAKNDLSIYLSVYLSIYQTIYL